MEFCPGGKIEDNLKSSFGEVNHLYNIPEGPCRLRAMPIAYRIMMDGKGKSSFKEKSSKKCNLQMMHWSTFNASTLLTLSSRSS